MNLQWWKYRGMQALKTEDEDESSLPPSFPKKQSPSRPWLLPTACTLLFVLSAISFNMRWSRPILQAPIELPPRSYMFEDHPELRPFDQETTELWRPFGKEHWWSMEWMDPSGHRLTAGIDMLHKLHCLMAVRDEFTLMATDPDRRTVFNAKTAESTTRRMHVKHCLDFIRQDILCQADATVEPLGPGYSRSDGLGVEHQCRDWDVIMKYADSNNYFPEQLRDLKNRQAAFG